MLNQIGELCGISFSVAASSSEAIKHSLDLDTEERNLQIAKSGDFLMSKVFFSQSSINKDNHVNSENYFYKISFVPVHKCLSSKLIFGRNRIAWLLIRFMSIRVSH